MGTAGGRLGQRRWPAPSAAGVAGPTVSSLAARSARQAHPHRGSACGSKLVSSPREAWGGDSSPSRARGRPRSRRGSARRQGFQVACPGFSIATPLRISRRAPASRRRKRRALLRFAPPFSAHSPCAKRLMRRCRAAGAGCSPTRAPPAVAEGQRRQPRPGQQPPREARDGDDAELEPLGAVHGHDPHPSCPR